MDTPDPMGELEGIHRTLRSIRFFLGAIILVALWRSFEGLMWEARAILIFMIYSAFFGLWRFAELFERRR